MKYTILAIILGIFFIAIISSCEKCNPQPPDPIDSIIKGEWMPIEDAPVTHFYPNKLFVDNTNNLLYSFTDSSLCVYNGQTWINLSNKFTFEDFFDIEQYNNKIFLALRRVKFNGYIHKDDWIISWNEDMIIDSIEIQHGDVYALTSNEEELILGGRNIDTINNIYVSNDVIGFDNLNFYPIGNIEYNYNIYSIMEEYNDKIFLSNTYNEVYMFNNNIWTKIFSNKITCIKETGGELYIANYDSTLLKYNNNEFEPLTNNYPFSKRIIHNLIKKDNYLYIAMDSPALSYDSISVPRWDGNNWKYLKSAIQNGYGVYDIVDYKNELYTVCNINGDFYIYKWIPE